tara:strand:- start:1365 stop:1595 length:231 start_codon:yes stop_codon:yes gene_type:complete
MLFEEKILKYEPHGCEYTMEDNTLFYRHDDTEEWIEVMLEHCIAEGEDYYEVFMYFGKDKYFRTNYLNQSEEGVKI